MKHVSAMMMTALAGASSIQPLSGQPFSEINRDDDDNAVDELNPS